MNPWSGSKESIVSEYKPMEIIKRGYMYNALKRKIIVNKES